MFPICWVADFSCGRGLLDDPDWEEVKEYLAKCYNDAGDDSDDGSAYALALSRRPPKYLHTPTKMHRRRICKVGWRDPDIGKAESTRDDGTIASSASTQKIFQDGPGAQILDIPITASCSTKNTKAPGGKTYWPGYIKSYDGTTKTLLMDLNENTRFSCLFLCWGTSNDHYSPFLTNTVANQSVFACLFMHNTPC
jgi:hypothetical protein